MIASPSTDGRAGIDAALVKRLVARQFPRWRALAVTPVEVDGWDNRTYRLGEHLSVRLPTAERYVPGVEKEQLWLPVLAPSLPLPIPEVAGQGVAGEGYPFPWSVCRWLPGRPARPDAIANLPAFAEELAAFIVALQRIDPTGGPAGGAHSFHRGADLAHYDDETRRALAALAGRMDTDRAAAVWDEALQTRWERPPVWFHGDVAVGNLLVGDGTLAAVIDFGTCGVGDPACDLVIAWTLLADDSRAVFRAGIDPDPGTWARARGWALWKALIILAPLDDRTPAAAAQRQVIDAVL